MTETTDQTKQPPIHCDPAKRHDFVLLFDVTDGNPNGDPDGGNLPRTDPETMQGLVTDVCLKRKIRNFVDLEYGQQETTKIYVQNKGIALNDLHKRAYEASKITSTGTKQKQKDVNEARTWMCQNFYDIRMFGAVMTTAFNCGQVRGPIQITFARSVDPIMPLDMAITRIAITKPEDAEVLESEDGSKKGGGKVTEMGRKTLIPYGLYVAHGFFSPYLAEQTGVTSTDLELFWDALMFMWDLDRSASRGQMSPRGLYIFSHAKKLGNAPAHKLFERIQIQRQDGILTPRKFADYDVVTQDSDLPDGITLTKLLEG